MSVGVFVEYVLDVGHYAYMHLLTSLASGVGDISLSYARFAQESEVYWGYASQVE